MDSVLQWFGEEKYRQNLARVRAFWKGNERFLVSLCSTHEGYRQLFKDDVILSKVGANLQHQASLPGINLPALFADFGTISTAKYWGGTPRFDSTGGNIFVDPVAATVADVLAITPVSVDDPAQDAAHAIRLYEKVCRQLGTESLWLRTPDVQGPFNTAGLIVNQEELMVAIHTEPEAVHQLLKKTTDFLISYLTYLHATTRGRVSGNIWPYAFFPADLGIALTEDLMPLLSVESYATFAVPYLRTLSQRFGGLMIHCCGDWGRHAPTLAKSRAKISAVEFWYPFTRIEELAPLAATTVFIPYIALDKQTDFKTATEYYEHLLAKTGAPYRYWFAFADDGDEARAFALSHGEW